MRTKLPHVYQNNILILLKTKNNKANLRGSIVKIKELIQLPQARQLFKNTSWSLIDATIYPLLMIVATPIFIHHLGPEYYGVWMLVNVLIQGMQLFNFGLGDTTIRKVSMFQARSDYENCNKAINSNISLGVVLLFVCFILGLVVSLTPILRLFHVSASENNIGVQLIILGSATAGMKFIELVFLGALKGLERFDLAAKLSLLSRGSVVLIAVLLVIYNYGLREIFMATVLINFINLLVQWLVLSIFHKGFWVHWVNPFRLIKTTEHRYNLWYWLQSVVGMCGFLFDKLLLSYLTDLKTLAYYSVAAMIGTQIHNVLTSFGIIVFPKVSARLERKQDFMPIYKWSRFAIAALGWGAVLFLFLTSDWLMAWWLGTETYLFSKPYIMLFLAYESVLIIAIVPYQIINGSEQLRYNTWFEIMHRSIQAFLIITLGKMFGGQGIIWGLIGGSSIALPYQYFILHKKVLKTISYKWPTMFLAPAFLVLFVLSKEPVYHLFGIVGFLLTFLWYYAKPVVKLLKIRLKQNG
jgi:O-antigen/teichoic acid export membrane protein